MTQIEEGASQLAVNTTLNFNETPDEILLEDVPSSFSDQHTSGHRSNGDANIERPPTAAASQSVQDNQSPHHRRQDSLAQNLRDVSLAAVAEPYLGTISGLTFAKLTQAVLRRLSPDGRDFVFNQHVDGNAVPIEGATILHLDLMDNVYFDSDQAIDFSFLVEGLPTLDAPTQDTTIQLPDRTEMLRLTNFYFDHSHTLYPILHQQEVMSDIHSIMLDPDGRLTQSPPCMFRIWMVLAIGSTAHASITLTEEFASRLYYEKAMTYFDASMDYGDIVSSPDILAEFYLALIRKRLPWKLSCCKYHIPSSTNSVQVRHLSRWLMHKVFSDRPSPRHVVSRRYCCTVSTRYGSPL